MARLTTLLEVPLNLLDWLKDTFPLKPPDPKASDREIWMEAGRQDLIQKLRYEHEKLQKAALPKGN